MNMQMQERRDYGFAIGLLTSTCVGAGLMLWLAPRVAGELRQLAIASANRVTARVSDAVDDLTRKGQGVGDGLEDRGGSRAVEERVSGRQHLETAIDEPLAAAA